MVMIKIAKNSRAGKTVHNQNFYKENNVSNWSQYLLIKISVPIKLLGIRIDIITHPAKMLVIVSLAGMALEFFVPFNQLNVSLSPL